MSNVSMQPTAEYTPVQADRPSYAPPEVVYEARLEAQAGSPLGLLDPFLPE